MNKLNKNKITKATDFHVYLNKQLKNKEFKKHYDEFGKQLEIAYQLMQLRKEKRMSQIELAKQIGNLQLFAEFIVVFLKFFVFKLLI